MCGRSLRGNREISRSTRGPVSHGPHREGEEPKPMMHGREKSDPAIVADEADEQGGAIRGGAGGAKGGGPRGMRASKARAGRRTGASVSQALERIRQAARQRKKERFTALLHHISIDLLRAAFYELKGKAAPGVDGMTWQDYEADLERKLEDLHARVQRRSVSGTAEPAGLHTQAGRPTTPVRGCCAGGQDRPTGDGRGAECDLRGRLPRVLVWVPARTRHA